MTLTLRAISLNGNPLTQPITAQFGADGGSVGRADHNTLSLPDPERHISRRHAEIVATDEGYAIRNVGSANPITVQGQPLARGASAALNHRDQVRIGGYLLEVAEEGAGIESGARGAKRLLSATTAPAQNGVIGSRPAMDGTAGCLAGLGASLSVANPFADLLSGVPTVSAPAALRALRSGHSLLKSDGVTAAQTSTGSSGAIEPRALRPSANAPAMPVDPFADLIPAANGIAGSSAAWAPPATRSVHALLPEDFDPFALPKVTLPSELSAPQTDEAGAGCFGDLIPNTEPASIDQLFHLQPNARDPLADFMAGVETHRHDDDAATTPGLAALSTDPLALFGQSITAVLEPGPSRDDDVPEWQSAFAPSTLRPLLQEPAVTAGGGALTAVGDSGRYSRTKAAVAGNDHGSPSAATAHAIKAPGDSSNLWSAFCAGAGIAIDPLPNVDSAHQMHLAGQLLRAAVAGTLQLIMVRATTKHELGADVTMIRARNNNPLKFSPDTSAALEQLLKPPMRGFLPGPAAMTDAMHDLVGHAIGTMAGTRAALEGVLDRFAPQQLEAQLVSRSMLDSLLPMNRKAKLWELYLHHFDAIRNEAQDDFDALFGRAFLIAYEQQLERLRQGEKDKTGSA